MEVMDINNLLCKTKPEVAAVIKSKSIHSENEDLKHLLDNLLAETNDIDDDEVIDWLRWIVAGGSTPEEFSSTVRHYDKATTCGLVWSENCVAYRCRTCGISPCMSLCTECFQRGNHKGHDFIVFRSETGGACDCGEISVIKESGCCSFHRPRSDSASSMNDQSAPAELLSVASGMMPRLFQRLILSMKEEYKRRMENPAKVKPIMTCKHNIENNNEAVPSLLVKGHKFIKLLQGFADMGQQMRQVMTLSLTDSQAYFGVTGSKKSPFKTFLESLVYWTVKFEFPEDLICLLLSMRSDSDYKEYFTRAFILQYKHISDTILQSFDPEKLCKHVAAVSVQLFGSQELAVKLVEQMNLLPLLVSALEDMIGRAIVDKSVGGVIDCDHDIMKNNLYWPIKSDLKELLSHTPVALQFFESPDLPVQWFRLLSNFQGMNPSTYISKDFPHVDQDTEMYIGAFTAELELSATPMWTLLSHLSDARTLHLTKKNIQDCLQYLLEWSNSTGRNKDQVSFHLPLHRNLSMLIKQALIFQGASLQELLPSPKIMKTICQQLTNLQSSFYQIRNRLWVRNGTEVLNQAESYTSSLACNYMIDADIFLLQIVSSGLSKVEFLTIVFEEFQIYRNLGLDEGEQEQLEDEEEQKQNVMVESCLLFLATLSSSRVNLGMSQETLMAVEMSTLLCKGDRHHSELMELLPERCGTDSQLKNFEKVKAEVAVFEAPRNMQQGKYIPKPFIWEKFYDPIHTLLRSSSKAEFQVSLDRYQEFVQRSNLSHPSAKLWPPFRHPLIDNTGPVPDPRRLLTSNFVLEVLYIILYRAVHMGNVPNFTVALTVYLLESAVSNQSEHEDEENCSSALGLFPTSDLEVNLTKKLKYPGLTPTSNVPEESIISLLVQLHHQLRDSREMQHPVVFSESRIGDGTYFVASLLNKMSLKFSTVCSQLNAEALQESPDQSFERERENRRKKAKERKLAIMTELAMKRQQFMQMNEDASSQEDVEMKEGNQDFQFECVICMEKGGSKCENPYGLITCLMPTGVLNHRKSVETFGLKEFYKPFWESQVAGMKSKFDGNSIRLSVPIQDDNGVNIQTCGHFLHQECFNSYIKSLKKPKINMNEREIGFLHNSHFSCPLCRQLGNSFLPVIKDSLSMSMKECEESDENELSRALKKKSTLVLSPKQKLGVEKFLENLQKVMGLSASESSFSSTKMAQSLSLVFLTVLEMEGLRSKSHSELHRSYILPLYSVLRYSYKSLSVGHSKKISQIWDAITGTGTRHFTSSTSTGIKSSGRDVPLLLKDLDVVLSHIVLQIPYGTEKKYISMITQKLLLLKLAQVLSALCLHLDHEDLEVVKSSFAQPTVLQQLLQKIIDHMSHSPSNISETLRQTSQVCPTTVSSLLRNASDLEAFILSRISPFARKLSDLTTLMLPESPTSVETALGDVYILISQPNFEKSFGFWLDELMQCVHCDLTQLSLSQLILWDDPKFIEIPAEYDKIFQSYRKIHCENCNTQPSEPALCLVCGKIVCLNSFCCLDKKTKMSEVIQHSYDCGNGTGIFLCVLSSAVLVTLSREACVWGSIFLDTFGEEDLDLRRGRPLYLSKERLQFLQRQWRTHSFHKFEFKWFPHENML